MVQFLPAFTLFTQTQEQNTVTKIKDAKQKGKKVTPEVVEAPKAAPKKAAPKKKAKVANAPAS